MYKDLVGTRKEAKEPLAKCNARDEYRSHLPVDGKKRHQKSLHDFRPPLCISPFTGGEITHPILTKFRSLPHLIQHCKKCRGGLIFLNITYLP